jgi:SpoVK/Ycf46/Vps4 family AAA+-type ATPase
MRKGRFDEIFFVDLPSVGERKEIFQIHLEKRHRDPSKFDLDMLASVTTGFSGSEIEQAVIDGLYKSFDEGADVTDKDIAACAKASVPLSMTMKENIDNLREWASKRCRPASTIPPEEVAPLSSRQALV